MILRIWHGRTTRGNAEAYERLVTEEVFPEIAAESAGGYLGYDLARRDHGEEIEYVTVTRFDSWDALKAFAGEEYEKAHVPAAARELLTEYDDRAEHYELRASESPPS